jgi:hypothetical protein
VVRWSDDQPLAKQVDLKPLLLIAGKGLPFVLFSFWFNYARLTAVRGRASNSEQGTSRFSRASTATASSSPGTSSATSRS